MERRYKQVCKESIKRGFKTVEIKFPKKKYIELNLYNDWKPDKELIKFCEEKLETLMKDNSFKKTTYNKV